MDEVKSTINTKKNNIEEKKLYADIFISGKTQGAIMPEMRRYNKIKEVAVTTDME